MTLVTTLGTGVLTPSPCGDVLVSWRQVARIHEVKPFRVDGRTASPKKLVKGSEGIRIGKVAKIDCYLNCFAAELLTPQVIHFW